MSERVKIAIDAMGGENSPNKIIDGIEISLKKNNENYFLLYGDKDILNKNISNNKLITTNSEIIDTKDVILDKRLSRYNLIYLYSLMKKIKKYNFT